MAQQNINVGAVANDGTGDKLRAAFVKTEANFTDLYTNKQAADATLTAISGQGTTGTGAVARTASPTFTGTLGAATIQTSGNIGAGVAPVRAMHAKSGTFEVLRLETTAADGAGAGWLSFNDAGGRKSYFGHGGNNNDFFIDVSAGDAVCSLAATYSFRPGSDNNRNLGTAAFRWGTVYAGTGTINTSDERGKAEIQNIPEALLDAWGEAACWQMFVMADALEAKGGTASIYLADEVREGARWHFGLVAQRVRAALESRGVNAVALGIVCYDAWDEQQTPEYEIQQVPTGRGKKRRMVDVSVPTGRMLVTREAGDRWGIRYDLAFAIEAAWNRRERDRFERRLEALERRLGEGV